MSLSHEKRRDRAVGSTDLEGVVLGEISQTQTMPCEFTSMWYFKKPQTEIRPAKSRLVGGGRRSGEDSRAQASSSRASRGDVKSSGQSMTGPRAAPGPCEAHCGDRVTRCINVESPYGASGLV